MYYLIFGFVFLLSLLPFWLLYLVSDVTAFLLYAVVRYRRAIVYANVRGSFPEKTDAEIRLICKQFYRNFTDNWIETIKLISISPARFNKRITGNFEMLEQLYKNGKPACGISGHFYNWEYLNFAVSLRQPYELISVYMPLTSSAMNRLFIYIRGRFGAHLMAATTLQREIIPWRKRQYLIGLVADQSPGDPSKAYWLQFLNRPTAVVTGPERNAQVFGQTPFFVRISRPKRGHYHFQFELLSLDDASLQKKGVITRLVTEKIESNIREHPALYLWSHRRWKHQWNDSFSNLWIDQQHPVPES